MPPVLVSRFLGGVLAAAIGLVPIAPPEHVHETDDHDDHQVIVHRHAQPHGGAHPSRHQGALTDDDGPVVVLPATYIVPSAPAGAVEQPSQVIRLIDPPLAESPNRPAEYVERVIHGPPRAPASLRAPPSTPAL